MDDIKTLIRSNGCKFELGLDDVFRKMYEPLYKDASPEVVTSIKDIKYGPTERNFLDLYVAVSGHVGKAILIYTHGGGFYSGDKAWSEKVYANIGNYFAQKGMIVVIGNHQLVPSVQYPGGADDIQLTREWVFNNIASPEYGQGDPNLVVLLGHSSGGAHIASNVFAAGDPARSSADPMSPPIAGLAFLSTPWWYDMKKPMRNRIIKQYYGTNIEDEWEPFSPLGLFKRLPESSPVLDTNYLPILLGSVKYEVPEATDGLLKFLDEYRRKSKPHGTLPLLNILDDHNHLSNIFSIGTDDDAQANILLAFVTECVKKRIQKNERSLSFPEGM